MKAEEAVGFVFSSFVLDLSSFILQPSSFLMARVLITAGPTRQYLDPVRYLTNASSGRMGRALAEAALELGHEVVVVSGPVSIEYPKAVDVRPIVSTEELLAACQELFPTCDGAIGAAA